MSSAISKSSRKPSAIDEQIRRGKAVLRELKATLEDLEDHQELAAAKERNAGKPGTNLLDAAKELGIDIPEFSMTATGGSALMPRRDRSRR